MVIFDTNILIEIYRGNIAVKEETERLQTDIFYVSSITVAEFMVGAKDKADLIRIEKQLEKYTAIPINAAITDIFINLFKTLTLGLVLPMPSLPQRPFIIICHCIHITKGIFNLYPISSWYKLPFA
jgi:predicted nucleic acid-binding protein